jgi:hypothetical protein
MQWAHLLQRGKQFRNGRAAWTSAGSPRIAKWRWHARPFDGSPEGLCPLREFCPERESNYWPGTRLHLEAGQGDAGSLVVWLIGEDSADGGVPG